MLNLLFQISHFNLQLCLDETGFKQDLEELDFGPQNYILIDLKEVYCQFHWCIAPGFGKILEWVPYFFFGRDNLSTFKVGSSQQCMFMLTVFKVVGLYVLHDCIERK